MEVLATRAAIAPAVRQRPNVATSATLEEIEVTSVIIEIKIFPIYTLYGMLVD